MQGSGCGEALRAALIGQPPEPERIGAALDVVYGRMPGTLEGIRTLQTLRDAILDACARARQGGGR